MAIRAIIEKITKDPDATVINVIYTDDTSFKASREYRLASFNLESFKSVVRAQISDFSNVDQVDKVLLLGEFDASPAGDPPPSADDMAKQKFLVDLRLRQKMEVAIRLGLMSEDSKEYLDQVALVQSEYKPEYVGIL